MEKNISNFEATLVAGLRKRRVMLGLTQQEVAEKSGVSLVTVNQVEGLKRNADLATLEKIASALDTSLNALSAQANGSVDKAKHVSRKILSENIKQLREEYGLSQQALASKAGVSTSTITSIESLRNGTSIDVLDEIALALQTSPSKLLSNLD